MVVKQRIILKLTQCLKHFYHKVYQSENKSSKKDTDNFLNNKTNLPIISEPDPRIWIETL